MLRQSWFGAYQKGSRTKLDGEILEEWVHSLNRELSMTPAVHVERVSPSHLRPIRSRGYTEFSKGKPNAVGFSQT